MSQLKFVEHVASQNPKYLVIFLHGYGANGKNLISLSHEFAHVLPDSHFISPNAPEAWEGGFPDSYQWFSLYSGFAYKSIAEMTPDVKRANKILTNFIDTQLERFSLTYKDLFLVGFSQGGMMSLYQGLIAPEKPAGIISFSGKLVLPELLGEEIISKPEMCLIHGEADSVVPFSNFLEAQELLNEKGINFESHSIPHLDHSIDIHGVKAAQNFIKKQTHHNEK
ncbi:MAG: phospholipase [Rickettsiales bacterium]|nr:phospholipase [Rickettsiales bacterium]